MEFVSSFPLTRTKKDLVWVIVDRFSKSAHFLIARTSYSMERIVELYIVKIVRLHNVLISIIFYKDP